MKSSALILVVDDNEAGMFLACSVLQREGFQVEPNVKVPVTALLRIDESSSDPTADHLHGTIEIHPAFEPM